MEKSELLKQLTILKRYQKILSLEGISLKDKLALEDIDPELVPDNIPNTLYPSLRSGILADKPLEKITDRIRILETELAKISFDELGESMRLVNHVYHCRELESLIPAEPREGFSQYLDSHQIAPESVTGVKLGKVDGKILLTMETAENATDMDLNEGLNLNVHDGLLLEIKNTDNDGFFTRVNNLVYLIQNPYLLVPLTKCNYLILFNDITDINSDPIVSFATTFNRIINQDMILDGKLNHTLIKTRIDELEAWLPDDFNMTSCGITATDFGVTINHIISTNFNIIDTVYNAFALTEPFEMSDAVKACRDNFDYDDGKVFIELNNRLWCHPYLLPCSTLCKPYLPK